MLASPTAQAILARKLVLPEVYDLMNRVQVGFSCSKQELVGLSCFKQESLPLKKPNQRKG